MNINDAIKYGTKENKGRLFIALNMAKQLNGLSTNEAESVINFLHEIVRDSSQIDDDRLSLICQQFGLSHYADHEHVQ